MQKSRPKTLPKVWFLSFCSVKLEKFESQRSDFCLEAKKAKQSDEKARAEAERCRKMSNQAIKEHASMKEHYTNNLNKLKWTENKLQAESDALGNICHILLCLHILLLGHF